jgi:outer membrane protein OmpA-like peptidoglycan-associated protein/polyisoprenoid-binding protein YceI
MPATNARVFLVVALLAAAAGMGGANAQDVVNRDWVLDPGRSHVYMETEKLEKVIEKKAFARVEGKVDQDGQASIKIDLASLDTGTDIRNVRMRFLLFETYKFPNALITAKLDKSRLRGLATKSSVTYPLTMKVEMHGVSHEFTTDVSVTRAGDDTVTVATVKPIVVGAETFGFGGGLAKLSDAMGGINIVPSAAITFDLTFASGDLKPALEAVQAQRNKESAEQQTKAITAEACETRFNVISETGAIYFKTDSAELDSKSEPLLDSGADIAKRCPSVKFEVNGYTDNVGGRRYNQRLSERRAKSVVDYLVAKGVETARIKATGYGESHPAVPNNSEANRAKNRRIEFKVVK